VDISTLFVAMCGGVILLGLFLALTEGFTEPEDAERIPGDW